MIGAKTNETRAASQKPYLTINTSVGVGDLGRRAKITVLKAQEPEPGGDGRNSEHQPAIEDQSGKKQDDDLLDNRHLDWFAIRHPNAPMRINLCGGWDTLPLP